MTSKTFLEISLDDQTLTLFSDGVDKAKYPISSARKGMGFAPSSNRTPTGNFTISHKIGKDLPIYTQFIGREPVGKWNPEKASPQDAILTRILRLQGTDPENKNTFDRFIYIHGTNHEAEIGQAKSQGCIRLRNNDLCELFDQIEEGTNVKILPLSKTGPKLLFIDCDSTLSSIEGIDEMARLSDPKTYAKVVSLTNSAMNGEIPLNEVFQKRMDIIKPSRELVAKVANRYLETIVPGVVPFIAQAKRQGWIPIVISGGFAPAILPLASYLEIDDVEAVPLYFDDNGEYIDFGKDHPNTRNLGKNQIIKDWKAAMLPAKTMMIGDGISDLETKPDVDQMIAFGGVVAREKVKDGASYFATSFDEITKLLSNIA